MGVAAGGNTFIDPLEVLLVEDNPGDVELCRVLLNEDDRGPFPLEVAPTLSTSLEMVGRRQFDALLVDLGLPDADGLEVVRALRRSTDAALVILTGRNDDVLAERALEAGAQDYLAKDKLAEGALGRVLRYAALRHRQRHVLELERRVIERELRLARKLEAVGRLAAGIAHEIKTPIQYVDHNLAFVADTVSDLSDLLEALGNFDIDDLTDDGARSRLVDTLARVDPQTVDELSSALEDARKGIQRVAGIAVSMGTFIYEGRGEPTEVDLGEALRATIAIAKPRYRAVAEVTLTIAPDLPSLRCFVGELNLAFLNLLTNAADAIAARAEETMGHIGIAVNWDADAVVVIVEDDGVGMPPEDVDKAFEPFFTTKGVGRGSGQGLAFVRRAVVEHHGGRIDVESEPGRGTRFAITLPR